MLLYTLFSSDLNLRPYLEKRIRALINFILIIISLFCTSVAVASPNLERAVGQMMMVGFYGKNVDENSTIVKEIKQYHIGGVILVNHRLPNSNKYTTNIRNPLQLKKLISQLQFFSQKYNNMPLLIAVNQEGGLINTLKPAQGFNNTNDPSQFELGQAKNQALIFTKTYKRALMLKELGINLNLAPVADLNINPNNPAVGKLKRSFGNDPDQVTQELQSAIEAYKKAGIYCTLKHFPGLGSASFNTDYGNADTTQVWNSVELLPYVKLIQTNAICPFVMTSHLVNRKLDKTGLPVSIAENVVTGLLRNKLRYKGIIITDDMDAAAIRTKISTAAAIKKAVLAGNNIIIFGGTQDQNPDEDAKILFETLIRHANNDPKVRSKVLKSYAKIIELKKSLYVKGEHV